MLTLLAIGVAGLAAGLWIAVDACRAPYVNSKMGGSFLRVPNDEAAPRKKCVAGGSREG